jgi:HEAT repeat protein
MECSKYREQIPLYLSNSLDQTQCRDLENHLASCAGCHMEYKTTQNVWNLMGEIPEPETPDTMRAGFNAILSNFKKEQMKDPNPITDWLRQIYLQWQLQIRPHLALSLVMIAIGLVSGYFLSRSGQSTMAYHKQIDSLSSQVSEMKQMMMLTLLQDPSASQRILAVGYTDEIDKVNNKVIEALLTTLNEDPNVNVRLITLEALIKYSNQPRVREGLVHSLTIQESPMLQSAIADAMVKLQEKKSVKSLQELLHKKNLNEMVKVKIEQSIQKLI